MAGAELWGCAFLKFEDMPRGPTDCCIHVAWAICCCII
jgi:hypothetical protein